MSDHWDEWWPVYVGGAVILGLCWLMMIGVQADNRQWQAFASTHACKIVGRMSGDTLVSPIISSKGGVAVTVTPDKTGWLCSDGVTYWRDN